MMERLDVSLLGIVVNRMNDVTFGQRTMDRHEHAGISDGPPRSFTEQSVG